MATYKKQRFFLLAVDPVHVGTGGYRLGRVDNSIVREPGTKVPKIPGTSLHGAIRSYAASLYENIAAAGKDNHEVKEPEKDPVCYTFGYVKGGNGGEGKAFSGVVSIFDAHILLFPVSSMAGPVWVTTLERLEEAGFSWGFGKEKKSINYGKDYPRNWNLESVYLSWERNEKKLNLGWLMLEKADDLIYVNTSEKIKIKWKKESLLQKVQGRLVVVQEALFSHIVNSNLEVRTSVAIDPERGAAMDKALFTYEAIPRGTFLTTEVVLDDYRSEWPLEGDRASKTKKGHPLPGGPWQGPLDVVKAGMRLLEWLGVGGMGTRGFGRLALAGESSEESLEKFFF